eukprot:s1430_g20.t3
MPATCGSESWIFALEFSRRFLAEPDFCAMAAITVALMSGKELKLDVSDSLTIWELKWHVSQQLGRGVVDVISPEGERLDDEVQVHFGIPALSFLHGHTASASDRCQPL